MGKALIDTYSDEEFKNIVKQSSSMKEISTKIGYTAISGDSLARIRKRIDFLNLSTEHFSEMNKRTVKRNEDNIFIENSTANQSTLRRWYKKGEYTPYICSICGQEPIWQGKDLTLILDHINGSNHDDRLENLRWICPNCNQQLDTTGSRNIKKEKLEKHYYCIDCGKEIYKGATRCAKCASKQNRICERPSREELKKLIRTTPFTQIGKMYNVSDNSIRKWCKSENLPSKSSEIKKYSDEEWEKI